MSNRQHTAATPPSVSHYVHGCRCDDCRKAQREYRAMKRKDPLSGDAITTRAQTIARSKALKEFRTMWPDRWDAILEDARQVAVDEAQGSIS